MRRHTCRVALVFAVGAVIVAWMYPGVRAGATVGAQIGIPPLAFDDGTGTEVSRLFDSVAGAGNFGNGVAASGDTVLVGAPDESSHQGAAHVFVRGTGMWSQQATLTPSVRTASEFVGVSVGVSGDTAVVGAPGGNGGKGTAYVFIRSGSTWSQQAALTAPDGALGDRFGETVAVDGDTIVIGAPNHSSYCGSAYVFRRSGSTWAQQTELAESSATVGARFGVSVAVRGDAIAVGAPRDYYLSEPGKAYVFVDTGSFWSRQEMLTASDGVANDFFGYSVAISTDTVLAGAPHNSVAKGSAYVFTRTMGRWSQQTTLTPADGISTDRFGCSVALSGDAPLVGASGAQPAGGGRWTGAAYLFNGQADDGVRWSQRQELTSSDATVADYFGYAVAVSGDTAVVGAFAMNGSNGEAYVFSGARPLTTLHDTTLTVSAPGVLANDLTPYARSLSASLTAGPAYGSAAVATSGAFTYRPTGSYRGLDTLRYRAYDGFRYSTSAATVTVRVTDRTATAYGDGVAVQTAKLAGSDAVDAGASNLNVGDQEGRTVGISGDTVVVGTGLPDGWRGAAYVFTRSASGWHQQAKLAAPGAPGDAFGYAVAISGDTVAVGAPYRDASRGAVYVFKRSGTSWPLQATVLPSSSTTGEDFGISVALSGNTLVAGAMAKDGGLGAAYVFARSGTAWTQQAKLTAGKRNAGDGFGEHVAVSGGTAVASSRWANQSRGEVCVFARSGTTWSRQATLTVPGAAVGDQLGQSVAVSGNTVAAGAIWERSSQGAVHVFTRSGTTWSAQTTLTASDTSNLLGSSCALEGDTLVAGAHGKNVGGISAAGGAYVFNRTGTKWTQQAPLTASDPTPFGYFGQSAALSSGTAVFGAPQSYGRGSAYVFTGCTPYTVHAEGTLDVPAPGIFANDTDPDGDHLTWRFISWHSEQIVSPDISGGSDAGHLTARMQPGFFGTAHFQYAVSGGLFDSSNITDVAIHVTKWAQPIEGADRYGTAIAASKAAFPTTGTCGTVILATGANYPDALGAAGLAGAAKAPILLVSGTTLRDDILAEMKRLTQGQAKKTVYILGSPVAIPTALENSVRARFGTTGVTYKRLQGTTRYATAEAVASEVAARAGGTFYKHAIVVTGRSYPDALVSGPIAYSRVMPILLVSDSVDASLSSTVASLGITDLYIVGSTGSVSTTAATQLAAIPGVTSCLRSCAATDPYAQSVAAAEWGRLLGLKWDHFGIATGEKFPDALGAAAAQGTVTAPVLLTPAASLDPGVQGLLSANNSSIATVRFFGSVTALHQNVRDSAMAAVQ